MGRAEQRRCAACWRADPTRKPSSEAAVSCSKLGAGAGSGGATRWPRPSAGSTKRSWRCCWRGRPHPRVSSTEGTGRSSSRRGGGWGAWRASTRRRRQGPSSPTSDRAWPPCSRTKAPTASPRCTLRRATAPWPPRRCSCATGPTPLRAISTAARRTTMRTSVRPPASIHRALSSPRSAASYSNTHSGCLPRCMLTLRAFPPRTCTSLALTATGHAVTAHPSPNTSPLLRRYAPAGAGSAASDGGRGARAHGAACEGARRGAAV